MGDPFAGKVLIECTLEILDKGLIVSMQDMGAAGITSSAVELAAKAGAGAEIYLDNVPLREKDMEPFEIALSESQERMLLAIEEENFDEVKALADKWNLECEIIGKIIPEDKYVLKDKGEIVANVPASLLTSSPKIEWPKREPVKVEVKYPKDETIMLERVTFQDSQISCTLYRNLRTNHGFTNSSTIRLKAGPCLGRETPWPSFT